MDLQMTELSILSTTEALALTATQVESLTATQAAKMTADQVAALASAEALPAAGPYVPAVGDIAILADGTKIKIGGVRTRRGSVHVMPVGGSWTDATGTALSQEG